MLQLSVDKLVAFQCLFSEPLIQANTCRMPLTVAWDACMHAACGIHRSQRGPKCACGFLGSQYAWLAKGKSAPALAAHPMGVCVHASPHTYMASKICAPRSPTRPRSTPCARIPHHRAAPACECSRRPTCACKSIIFSISNFSQNFIPK